MTGIASKYLHFGLDFLRFNFDPIFNSTLFESFFIGLSDNSNYLRYRWFDISFDVSFIGQGNKDILTFSYDGVPVICLEKMKDTGFLTNISYTVIFYGGFFSVDKDFSGLFLQKFVDSYKDDCRVARIDIALDIPVSMKKFFRSGYKTNFIKGSKYGINERTGTFETRYFGTKGTRKHLIRVYDKKLDSAKKGKMGMYIDYFSHEAVTRVETEIRAHSCGIFGATPEKILDKKYLMELFKSICMNDRGTMFRYLKHIKFNVKTLPYHKKLAIEDFDQIDYVRRFIGYAKGLHDAGLNPFEILAKSKEYKKHTTYDNPVDDYARNVKLKVGSVIGVNTLHY